MGWTWEHKRILGFCFCTLLRLRREKTERNNTNTRVSEEERKKTQDFSRTEPLTIKDLLFLYFREGPNLLLLLSVFGSAQFCRFHSFARTPCHGSIPIFLLLRLVFFYIQKKVTFFLQNLEYPFYDFGFFGWKRFQFCRNFCWGWWKIVKLIDWPRFVFMLLWREFVSFLGNPEFITLQVGFFHCFWFLLELKVFRA